MKEVKILAVAKKPILSREASNNYEHHQLMWDIVDNHESHGGSPIIIGIVSINPSPMNNKMTPRYKVEFPDGSIDYLKIDMFDKFYEMKSISEERKSNIVINMTITIDNKNEIENYLKTIEDRTSSLGERLVESFKNLGKKI